ncbi:MAG TPA: cyclase family protein [Armatimonadota bacterium]|nr:cyclase family protein [Armatimonadota bacterium]HOS42290.1 cyclase family protein [Armatimonadota bacterium]
MRYDVTLAISPAMAVWPGDPPVTAEHLDVGTVRVSRWCLGSHAGTHVDAPRHFSAGPGTVDALDPDALIGPCRLLHLPDVPRVTAAALAAHPLAGVSRLLLRTRTSEHWRRAPHVFPEDFVGLDPSAARLLRDLGVQLVGIDSLSIEAPPITGEVHTTLLGANIILLEGLALAAVPPGDYTLLCAPLKLQGADGAPARVFLEG